jgi:glycosyltransferase involved in cell wall biosynthesis
MTAQRPRISIVTPSFNQGKYLEATIRSVLDQNYPNLDYVIIDGGSTDGSMDIIRRYADRLSYWVSEPDGGQYAALNKGFAHTTGEIMAWLNSDDMYLPWTLDVVARAFDADPTIDWLTTAFPMMWDTDGALIRCNSYSFTSRDVLRGGCLPARPWRGRGCIQQESTFWTRRLWVQAGGRLATELAYAGDFELWTRFARHAELRTIRLPLAGFRMHDEQKTCAGLLQYFEESDLVLRRLGVRPPHVKNFIKGVGRRMLRAWRHVSGWAAGYGLIKPAPPPVILSDRIAQRTAKKSA